MFWLEAGVTKDLCETNIFPRPNRNDQTHVPPLHTCALDIVQKTYRVFMSLVWTLISKRTVLPPPLVNRTGPLWKDNHPIQRPKVEYVYAIHTYMRQRILSHSTYIHMYIGRQNPSNVDFPNIFMASMATTHLTSTSLKRDVWFDFCCPVWIQFETTIATTASFLLVLLAELSEEDCSVFPN